MSKFNNKTPGKIMEIRTRIAQRTVTRNEQHDFGITDSKLRNVGTSVEYSVQVFEPIHDGWKDGYYHRAPGVYLCWYGHATRDGERFGALQTTHFCATEDERDKQVRKYIESARLRAEKANKVAR